MKARNKRVLTIIGAIAAAVCAVVLIVKLLKPRGEQSVDRKAMRKSQQGELDAVAMYDALADLVESERDAAVFRRLSEDERLLSYPEVRRIQADENRHGDMVLALIGEKA